MKGEGVIIGYANRFVYSGIRGGLRPASLVEQLNGTPSDFFLPDLARQGTGTSGG